MGNGVNRTRISQKSLPANARRIPIPAAALGPWLAEIENPDELRVTLRAVALITDSVSRPHLPASVSLHELLDDTFLMQGCASENIRASLSAALERSTLLATSVRSEIRILLNDEAAQRYLERTNLPLLSPADALGALSQITPTQWLPQKQPGEQRANIFTLYEKHIGPYGHSMAEQLKAAESEYPTQWIEDAFAAAIERNAASWNYVHAILRRWLKEGRYSGTESSATQQLDQYHEHGKPGHDTAPDSRTGYLDSYRRRHGRLPWEDGEPNSE